ncbi:P-loop containing nucleoside triphosphate hydrolase protein [Mycena floridula]|nr:P-loop containing nucleoside triphosphate hydrolase protein [Mycena floridula]
MGKRRSAPASESDDESQTASKRSRVEQVADKAPTKKRASTKKKRPTESDDDEPLPEADEDDNEDDEENRAAVWAKLKSRKGLKGSVADHGIIESIEMHQFMCHKYLTFSFGPQINFIIGHNGSGKSAVLSAITVVLGGKANTTGRGTGLKSFIREGQSVSEVTISLKNQGDEAFKPELYGKSIVITRKFTKEGSSSWKIMSKHGKVISTKKDELSAICDHMNIQVDNPMNVLTQDAARQFLSASRADEKYKFFLKGTQLSQLSTEYDLVQENVTTTDSVLTQKGEALPDLLAAASEAKRRYEEANKAREQKKKLDDLKREKAWALVATKDAELEAKVREHERAKRGPVKVQESLEAAQTALESATDKVQRLEERHRELGNIDHLAQQRADIKSQMAEKKTQIGDCARELKQMDGLVKSYKLQIINYEKQISEETKRLEADTHAKREESRQNIEEARIALEDAQSELQKIQDEIQSENQKSDDYRKQGLPKEEELKQLQAKIKDCDKMLSTISDVEKNKYAMYGQNMGALLEHIKKSKWVGEPPLGPLGIHVKCKDPETWAKLLANQLGGILTAFAVTTPQDQKLMKQLLEKYKNPNTLIIIYGKDLFDYQHGEPPENLLTVLRALEINDPYVLRILINQASIERTLLGRDRREGEQMLRTLPHGGSAWTADGFRLIRFPEGGESTQPLPKFDHSRTMLLTGRSAASETRTVTATRSEYTKRNQTLNAEIADLKAGYVQSRSKIDQLKKQESSVIRNVGKAKAKHSQLQQEVNEAMPANISGLEAAKMSAEDDRDSVLAQAKSVAEDKAKLDQENKDLLTESNAIKKKMDEFDETVNAATAGVELAAQERVQAQSNVRHWEKKLETENATVKAIQTALDALQIEHSEWTTKAEEYCERFPNPRSLEEVERQIVSTSAALKHKAQKSGASVDELLQEYTQATAKHELARKDWREMVKLNTILRNSIVTRRSRWEEFRRHIALRCKLVFQYHLSHRGYFGKVMFDHKLKTLNLKVQTDDTATQQSSRDKDPRSLSGGEKSFSTICLLLSLWESIGCPLRCLDEFDVFMDAVNRRISMKMMIDTANQSDKKQYILITPQDMGNVELGTTVRVLRMEDPSRTQGTLAFT